MSDTSRSTASMRHEAPSVRVQSILYDLAIENIERALDFLDNAARVALSSGVCRQVEVAYGDCSPSRTVDEDKLAEWRKQFSFLSGIEYTYFAANLGSAAGHNRLLKAASDSDFIMIMNPDVVAAPTLIVEMMETLGREGVGLVEARQLPIEHPKDYDPVTGETSWASTACAMGSSSLFRQLGGFDSDTFFLYCDDVDFSWRVRLAGYKVILNCAAVVFHDKRLSDQAGWVTSAAERYYSAEAGLLLPYKYSRSDLTKLYLEHFRQSGEEHFQKAAASFELRQSTGRLPAQIDQDHAVAQFIEGAYAVHRFKAV